MKGTSSFRNYRSDRLSDQDLEDIRGIILECLGELSEQLTPNGRDPKVEYLKTSQVSEITGFSQATLETFRAKRMGPPFYKQGYNVRYRADEVREWMEADRIQ
ncbi:helix-turn-helix domain-containing protein [Pseudohalocynthiibacter aestuariivivens]|nr:helix-turn-helix domain-containing protein [Pseudohalocynthiibacter aestuariivivens]QIE45823.1 helix-turn-helix domain-containing protein [Pseudohalocynthiibacter aestuariivivens]